MPTALPWMTQDANGNMFAQKPVNAPQAASWTSGGLTTTGTLNPFGLAINKAGGVIDPYSGYGSSPNYSAYSPFATNPNPAPGLPASPAPGSSDFNPVTNAPYGWPGATGPGSELTGPPNNAIDVFGNIAAGNAGTGTTGMPGVSPANPAGTLTPPAAAPNSSNPFSWLQNVIGTSFSPSNSTSPFAQGMNSLQFASPDTASLLAQYLGGSAGGMNIGGPGMSWSQPMQMITMPNGQQLNAGLVADLIQRYGQTNPQQVYNQLAQDSRMTSQPGSSIPGLAAPSTGSTVGGTSAGSNTINAPTTGQGGSLSPTTPNIFLPPPFGGSTSLAGGTAGNSPDQFLADFTNNSGYLTGIAENAGYPTNVTPAWQSMIEAQKRQQEKQFANLQASFAASGNRFSSDFGSAATDYWNQATADQNSMLGQMLLQSQEGARGRELSAAQQLAQMGFTGGQQLSSQGFQSQMQQQQQQLQAALAMLSSGGSSANLMAQLGAQGAMGLQQGAITGAQGLFGAENSASQQEIQRQLLLQQLGISSAQTASQLWQSNLGLGSQIGQQQFTNNTAAAQAQLQEWLRTQPQYNPLLQLIYSSTTGFPPVTAPSYQPSWWQSLLGAAGGIAQGVGTAYASDQRLKTNVEFVTAKNGFRLYRFNYLGDSSRYEGVLADELLQTHPEAVLIDEDGYLLVDYSKLGIELRRVA